MKQTEKILLAVANGKGGVGKSTICGELSEWLRYQNVNHLLVDADSNRSLTKLHPDAVPHDLRGTEGVEALITKLADEDVVLADLPGNTTGDLADLFGQVDFAPALEAINARLLFILPLPSRDSAALDEITRLVAAVKTAGSYAVIRNLRNGNEFDQFENAPVAAVFKKLGSPIIDFPQLDARLQAVLNGNRWTLAKYIGHHWGLEKTDRNAFFRGTVTAHHAQKAATAAFGAFNTIAEHLLPTKLSAKVTPIENLKAYSVSRWAAQAK